MLIRLCIGIWNPRMLWSVRMGIWSWLIWALVRRLIIRPLGRHLLLLALPIIWRRRYCPERAIITQLISGPLGLSCMSSWPDMSLSARMQKIHMKYIRKFSRIPLLSQNTWETQFPTHSSPNSSAKIQIQDLVAHIQIWKNTCYSKALIGINLLTRKWNHVSNYQRINS